MKTLNLMDFPLDGLSLIEASAGTGKTYALANLYLRYLLEKQFTVEQILVVTFTEAATQELKDRIRSRIRELGEVFDGAESKDEMLTGLFQASSQIPNRIAADRLRLKIAERQIDQAEIHTIHGFCQQLLRKHALDSNSPMQQSLLEDQKPLYKQVIQDFWRQQVLKLEWNELVYVNANWSGPEELLQAISPLLNRPPEQVIPSPIHQTGKKAIDAWSECYKETHAWFSILKEKTLESIDDIDELIAGSDLKRLKDKQNWLGKLRDWSQQGEMDFSLPVNSNKKNLFEMFVPDYLIEQTKAKGTTPEHSYFHFLARHLDTQPSSLLQAQFVVQTYQCVNDMVKAVKKDLRVVSFDDLILNVAHALNSEASEVNENPGNKSFAETVRNRYNVALIDEFQDTDQAQYSIFSTLFGPGAELGIGVDSSAKDENLSRLVLIGDPKQAIYSFRGGDISTYLKAKYEISNHSKGAVFTMDTNWRSSPEMVAAVNALFTGFDNPFRAENIPFYAVKAAKDSNAQLSGPALTITQLESAELNKEQISSALADCSVQQIQNLLAEFDGKAGGSARSFKNSDIAILVRSGKEGELMKQRLSQIGISASFEGKSSIFQTPEALAIYYLLHAVADPRNEYAVRRCLAELLYGVDDTQFRYLNEQPEELARYLEIFEDLQRRWSLSGVLAMIREALRRLEVYDAWKSPGGTTVGTSGAGPDYSAQQNHQGAAWANEWERSLSNINQLAELLQQQTRIYRGHFALIRWLRDSISSAAAADDESRLRLESDEQLIRIVTIHKSKGLEYPFVFVPFLFSARAADQAWFYSDKINDSEVRLTLDLLKDKTNMEKADAERLAEDVRLLYVALTRAKYQCYVGTAAYNGRGGASQGLAKTAWGSLLFQNEMPKPLNDEALMNTLQTLERGSKGVIAVQYLNTDDVTAGKNRSVNNSAVSVSSKDAVAVFQAQTLTMPINNTWRVQSFTGLMHEAHAQQIHSSQGAQTKAVSANEQISIFSFPKGSRAGIFLHTLFESVVFDTAEPLDRLKPHYESLEALIHDRLSLSKLLEEDVLPQWTLYLQRWIRSVLAFPLGDGFCLADLNERAYVSELEFYFSVKQLKSQGFNALMHQFNYPAAGIDFATFEGHLKGAIDLVFRANGKYYILDYKSNYLGPEIEDYQSEALIAAMDEHRYDVQYILYTLATHRYLTHRLGEAYCYERDFGGVYYLFLRGLALESVDPKNCPDTGIVFVKPPFELIDALDKEVSA